MSGTVSLLVGLLVLAYLGGSLFKQRSNRDFGLASGAEYIVLGFLLGPLLGLIGRDLLGSFAAIHRVGAAWLGLLAGLGYGVVTRRSLGRAALGVGLTVVVGAAVAATTWFASGHWLRLSSIDRLSLSLGAAVLCCATTHVSPWFATPRREASPLTRALRDLARASALVPAVALAAVLAGVPAHPLLVLDPLGRTLATLGVGVVLGLLATLLLGREFRSNESWGLLLGLSVLGAGVSIRLGLSSVACSFCFGLVISLISRHSNELRLMVAHTEKAAMLPVALLAGASVALDVVPWLPLVIVLVVALGTRVLAEFVRGFLLWLSLPAVRSGGPWLGPAMTATGGFTLAAAVELHYALGPPLGTVLLVLGATAAVFGALLGPLQLRRVLARAGELEDGETDDAVIPPLRPLSLSERDSKT